jgi:hypothetical protein
VTRVYNLSSDEFLVFRFTGMLGSSYVHGVIKIFVTFGERSFGDEISITNTNWGFDSVINVVLVFIKYLYDFKVVDVLFPSASQYRIAQHLPYISNWDFNFALGSDNRNTFSFLVGVNLCCKGL